MPGVSDASDALTCAEFVEIATDYLEHALSPHDTDRFEAHVRACDGCDIYLDQLQETVRLVGKLDTTALTPQAEAAFLDAFRDWKREG
jgi:hypothetical protein